MMNIKYTRMSSVISAAKKTGSINNWGEWRRISNFLTSRCSDVKRSLCVGCGKGRLYDKNGISYPVTAKNTFEEVEKIVELIRQINKQDGTQS